MLLAACGEDSDLVKGNDVISAKTNLTLDLPSQELQEVPDIYLFIYVFSACSSPILILKQILALSGFPWVIFCF